jgi:3-oxoacyl-(acyl-carrier-protein) synthase
MPQTLSITAISSISALGNDTKLVWKNYLNDKHFITEKFFNNKNTFVAQLDENSKKTIENLKKSDNKYKNLDDSVLFAIIVSRQAIEKAGWNATDNFGINIGSSRGATALFESHYKDFLTSGKANVLSSPTTTLGNISSWVAHDLQTDGPEISHSITCSTALHALLNGVAWLKSGMATKFLVGGSEAPLTDFTIAQMQAMKIYAKENPEKNPAEFPCRALDFDKKQNTMVLGEGAAVCCLEIGKSDKTLALIEGIGYATEILEHNTSISAEAICFQKSMKMALQNIDLQDIDAIVMHAPGTIQGDLSEMKAIEKVFGSTIPLLTSNKWKLGHSFGASGMLSIELAIMMLQQQFFIGLPFAKAKSQPKSIKKVLVNSVGFGGNAVSVVLGI